MIDSLRQDAAQDQEALRARCLMIDILEEAIDRLARAGFSPVLEMSPGALVVLRLDPYAWALRQVAAPRVLDRAPEKPSLGPVPVVDLGHLTWTPDPGFIIQNPVLAPNTCAVVDAGTAPHSLRPDAPAPKVDAARATDGAGRLVWTPEMDALILRDRDAGKPASDSAKALGIAVQPVYARLSRLREKGVAMAAPSSTRLNPFAKPTMRADGAEMREWTADDDAALIAAYGAGQDLKSLARDVGRSHSALTKRLTALRRSGKITQYRGCVPNDLKWPEERIARLRELWPIRRLPVIAHEFGLSYGAISGMAHRLGLGPGFKGVTLHATPAPIAPPAAMPEQKSEPLSASVVQPVAEVEPVHAPEPAAGPIPAPVQSAASGPHRVLPGMTAAQKAAAIAAHLDYVPADATFDAEADLALCEAVFGGGGGLALFAADFGIDTRAATERFKRLTAAFADPKKKGLPIEAASLILPALRARVKAKRGVAA